MISAELKAAWRPVVLPAGVERVAGHDDLAALFRAQLPEIVTALAVAGVDSAALLLVAGGEHVTIVADRAVIRAELERLGPIARTLRAKLKTRAPRHMHHAIAVDDRDRGFSALIVGPRSELAPQGSA